MCAAMVNVLGRTLSTPAFPEYTYAPVFGSYIEESLELLERSGFHASFRDNLEDWVETMRGASAIVAINPSFDPDLHDLHEDVYSIVVTDDDGDRVACMACRMIVTDSFYDLMRTGRLWYPPSRAQPVNFVLEGTGPSGVLSHCGGLWVHPKTRGAGLSWLIPRMMGANAVRMWNVDHHTGIVLENLLARGVPIKNYGVGKAALAVDGYFSVTGKHEHVYTVETTRDELEERTRSDLHEIRRDRHKQVRDFAPIARKRNDQPAVANHATA